MIRRLLLDPSAAERWPGWVALSWVLVAGAVWVMRPMFLLPWLVLMLAFGG